MKRTSTKSCWLTMLLFLTPLVALGGETQLAPQEAGASPTQLRAAVHAEQTGQPISPFIYGQFIEHLGRCIYGGIWAEMLEDRKFYFPITEGYDPYKSLQDTDFPVVGASPWQIIGDPESLLMVKEESFVGDHTPRVRPGAGIRQRDLALVQGKRYDGYIWLKTQSGSGGPAEVALVWGDDPAQRQIHTIKAGFSPATRTSSMATSVVALAVNAKPYFWYFWEIAWIVWVCRCVGSSPQIRATSTRPPDPRGDLSQT